MSLAVLGQMRGHPNQFGMKEVPPLRKIIDEDSMNKNDCGETVKQRFNVQMYFAITYVLNVLLI